MSTHNNFFKWDFNHLVFLLIPTMLRQPKMLAFVQVLASGINEVYNKLLDFRKQAEYEILFSGERKQFEHYLNDKFDTENRQIRIVNANFLHQIYLYKAIESRSLKIYKYSENKTLRAYKKEEYAISIHFIIQIPNGLLTDLQEKALRVYVDNRKLPNKNYTIQYI